MFDTNIVVVGNVLTAPEWRRTASTNALVANFRVASTARRLDKETGRWVDSNQFRVRVTCWRKLAEGVASSIRVGDPVVVAGRLYTRDWNDADGNLRTAYEMEAVSVGHDLARGRGRFFRNKPAGATSTVETESEGQIRGEATVPVPDEEAPTAYGEGILDGDEPTFADVPSTSPGGFDPLEVLRAGTIEPFDTSMVIPPASSGAVGAAVPTPDPTAGPESRSGSGLDEPGTGVPERDISADALDGEPSSRRGRGRGSRRQPVPA